MRSLRWAVAVPGAQAQGGGSATCTNTVAVPRDKTFGDFLLTKGIYRVTVSDSGDLSCALAIKELRGFVAQPGAAVPEGWDVNAGRGSSCGRTARTVSASSR